jgi:hypothetical protein
MAAAGVVSLALIAIFVALTVSVVDARRSLDDRMSDSFTTVVSRDHPSRSVLARGCVKARVDLYRCSADVRHADGTSRTMYWTVLLGEDGCWRAYHRWPEVAHGSAEAKLGHPRGCAR